MIHLGPVEPGLNRIRTLFLQEGWPASLSDDAFRALGAGHSAAERAVGLAAWQLRLLDEYRSQVAFTSFLADVTELRCPFDVVAAVLRVVRDEARHVELCRRMVVALGGGHDLPGEPTWTGADPRLPLRLRILWTISGSLCIGETLSAAMIAAARDHATDPVAVEVCSVLARDEAVHGALGWKLLELFLPHLSPSEVDAVKSFLPAQLSAASAAMRPSASAMPRPGISHPFGSVPPQTREALVERATQKAVLARFHRLGISLSPAA